MSISDRISVPFSVEDGNYLAYEERGSGRRGFFPSSISSFCFETLLSKYFALFCSLTCSVDNSVCRQAKGIKRQNLDTRLYKFVLIPADSCQKYLLLD